ncbi:hypothetical protein CD928_12230 [Sphingopyxis sp. GW247-27LB]|nr:hypothetical protein CD928_12230 [Sphingopyxis sp. GW247-27LB]
MPVLAKAKKKAGKPLRRDKFERHERLCKLIQQTIEGTLTGGMAYDFEGFVWAVRPEPEWAKLVGVKSVDTITDLTKLPPIQKDYTQIDSTKALLLRLGSPAPPSPRKIATAMRKAFKAKTGRYPKPKEFPLLKVLAEEWPDDLQVQIFQTALDEWVPFKVGVANEIEAMKAKGLKAYHRHHHFPSVSVICKFRQIALELYVMRLQEKVAQGKGVPMAAITAFPKLFGHIKPK